MVKKHIEMNIQTLKYEIIELVTKTNDNFLLKTLKSIIDSNARTTAGWYDELSDEEIESINRGIENHEKGEVLTSEEFWSGYED
jgi:hypothetical protein